MAAAGAPDSQPAPSSDPSRSNAITTERLTSENPRSGILITFLQFLVVSLYALPAQFVFSARLPRLRKRRVPLLPYFAQVALFFALSVLNNAAFAYDIPMSVHIVFRSGGMIVNLLLGWLFVNKRYVPLPPPRRNDSTIASPDIPPIKSSPYS